MDPPATAPIPSLLDFTARDLLQHYPNIPLWAITAFFVLQRHPLSWTPEARALLNMACVPTTAYPLQAFDLRVGTLSEELKDSFATEADWEKAKEEIDLWRLSRDLNGAKKDGWGQCKGKVDRL